MTKSKWIVIGCFLSCGAVAASEDEALNCDPVLKLRAEAEFISRVPNLAVENIDSTFDTFTADEPANARALALTEKLVRLNTSDAAGLLLHGPPGSGKSHLLVAAARLATELKMRVLYLTPPNLTTYRRHRLKPVSLKNVFNADLRARIELNNRSPSWSAAQPIGTVLKRFDLVIVDDLNARDVLPEFAAIVTFAHRAEGLKLLVATNIGPETLLARTYAQDPVAKARFQDRFDTIFATHELNGPSRRARAAWADD